VPISRVLLRFGLGLAASLATGFLVFGPAVLSPGSTQFQVVSVGAFCAAVLALMRCGRLGAALVLAVAWGLFKLGLVQSAGWAAAASGIVMGCGVFVSALIFDLIARRGIFFGKFLVLGPLLAGVFLAYVPLARFHDLTQASALQILMQYVFIGLVVGNGVGLGVEVADLFGGSFGQGDASPKPGEPVASGESRFTRGHHFER